MQQGIIASYEAGRGIIQATSGEEIPFSLGYIRNVYLVKGKRFISGSLRTNLRVPCSGEEVFFEKKTTGPPQAQFVIFADEWRKLSKDTT